MEFFSCGIGNKSYTASRIQTPTGALTDSEANALEAAIKEALKRPVLMRTHGKGFNGRLIPAQVYSVLFSDVTALRMLLQCNMPVTDEHKQEFIGAAWHGWYQCVYMSWLAFTFELYAKLEKRPDGRGATLTVTTCKDESVQRAWNLVCDNDGLFFQKALRDVGVGANSVQACSANMVNAIAMLRTTEHTNFFAYQHCTDNDDAKTKSYFLSMAQAAFWVRSVITEHLLRGVHYEGTVKPLFAAMDTGLKKADKKSLKALKGEILEAIVCLTLAEGCLQFIAKAQAIFLPERPAFIAGTTFQPCKLYDLPVPLGG